MFQEYNVYASIFSYSMEIGAKVTIKEIHKGKEVGR